MLHEIENMKDHYLICGHGRMGEILCEELAREEVPFVVIEGNAETAEVLTDQGYRVVEGDATEDDVLGRAGVTRAKGLVAVVSRPSPAVSLPRHSAGQETGANSN